MFRHYLSFLYTRVRSRNPKRKILLTSNTLPWSICLLLQRERDDKKCGRGQAHSVLINDTRLIFSDCSNQSEIAIKEHSWNWALGSDIRRGEQGVRDSVTQEALSVCYSSPFRDDSSSGKPVLTSTGWENCSGYEEAIFLWIDVCVSFQFHRSRVCNQSSAPTQTRWGPLASQSVGAGMR